MKKITQNYPVTNQMHDFCRTFERDLSLPQMGRFKELLHGIIRGKRAILSEIARQNRKKEGKSVRKQVQQYSDMLLKFPLINMVTRKLVGFKADIHLDTPLYYDLTDISKLYHKSMEAIGTTWNGSEGVPGKGYEIIDISLGYEGGCVSLIRHTYSTAEEDYKSQNEELKEVLNMLQNAWGEIRGTLFFDAGADSDITLQTLMDAEASFCIRMNVNRKKSDRIFINEEGEEVKMMELWSKKAQGITAWKDKKEKKKKTVQLQWRKVYKRMRRGERQGELIPLYLVWCHREGDPNPCVFLTSRIVQTEAEAEKLYRQYFARGAEEAVFKCHKDKLGMEEIQLQSLEKIKAFMWLYALADQLLYKLHCMALEVKHVVHLMVNDFLRGTQRWITKWAVIDWYEDCWQKMERLTFRLKGRYPPPNAQIQMTLFFNPPQKW